MDIKTWLDQAKKQIDSLDAEVIAVRAFAPKSISDRSWLVGHNLDIIDPAWRDHANRMLAQRRRGVPLAYILGEKEFYGRKFMVNQDVLIPRPETENLIGLVKTLELPQKPSFLEIGTGSGCIAITLALEFPQSYVVATDISVKALEVAERNDVQHEGRVELVQSNLLRDLGFERGPEHFDVVVANLPYVNKDWTWVNRENLGFEPAKALYARGNNGLSFYQRFFRELNYHQNIHELWVDYVVVEADPCQHRSLIQMAKKAGFWHLRTDGYGLLLETDWHYWYDAKEDKFVRKPQEVIASEQESGIIHWLPEQYDRDKRNDDI